MQRRSRPTVHVDAFLYDEDQVDSLCEDGTMSRSYCLACGSFKTAPLGETFIIITYIIIRLMLQLPAHPEEGKMATGSQWFSSSLLK